MGFICSQTYGTPVQCHKELEIRHLLSLVEGNIEDGSIVVDTLKDIHLGDKTIIIVTLSAMKLWVKKMKKKPDAIFN